MTEASDFGRAIREFKQHLKDVEEADLDETEMSAVNAFGNYLDATRLTVLTSADIETILDSFLEKNSDFKTQQDLLQTFVRHSSISKAITSKNCRRHLTPLLDVAKNKTFQVKIDHVQRKESRMASEDIVIGYLNLSKLIITKGLVDRLKNETYVADVTLETFPYHPQDLQDLFWIDVRNCEFQATDLDKLKTFISELPSQQLTNQIFLNCLSQNSEADSSSWFPSWVFGLSNAHNSISVKVPVLDLRNNPLVLYHRSHAQAKFREVCDLCCFILVSDTPVSSEIHKNFLKNHVKYSMDRSFRLIFLDEFEYMAPFWHSWFSKAEKKFIEDYHAEFYSSFYSEVIGVLESIDSYEKSDSLFSWP